MGFGATGYAADVLEESVKSRRQHRRDRRPHDVGDALLRRHRRHLRHRRAGHQGPVHAERRHQELPPVEPVLGRQRHAAAGDGRPVRRAGHRVRRRRVRGRAVAQVQLRLRGVPRLRPGELPEGGLLQGGAARRAWRRCCRRTSGSTWCRSRAWRRSGASSSCRAAPSTTWRRSRPRSTTSRSACPAPRSTSTRTPARPARSARRSRRCAWSSGAATRPSSASTRPSTSSTTATQRREHALPLLPEQLRAHVHRHRRRPTATPRATSPASPARRARSSREEAMLALTTERKKLMKQFPNLVDYEAKLLFRHFYDAEPMPADGEVIDGRRGRADAARRRRKRAESSAPSSARRAEAWEARRAHPHRHPEGAEHLVDGAASGGPTSRRSASRSRTSSSPTTPREEMWAEGGKYGSIDPCYPSKVGQAHIHNLLFHQHTRRQAAQVHLLPMHHPRAVVRRRTRWTTPSCPIVAGAPEGHARRPSPRRSTSSPSAASSTSTRRSRCTEPHLLAQPDVRGLGRAARRHRGRVRLRVRAGLRRRSTRSTRDMQAQAARRSSSRSRRRTGSRC